MARINKTVRLAHETKLCIDELVSIKELELREELSNGLILKLEESLFNTNEEILNGVSCNVVLKVTSGSVIEQAYRNTVKYTKTDWEKMRTRMESELSQVDYSKESSVTPKLYMNEEVLNGLKLYQDEWRYNEPGKRLIRLSYVIKLVVFAEYFNQKYI
ncbi:MULTISPECIES: hypothetical protein [unclassified Enterococcus]|uniref:hypothetical protein n=1 Tax=unclassified Enterococcus TaxID=2608891 RepID=UPI00259B27B6|nr:MULTISPECIES: hypothetical protein [unclassified Enterococcus]MDO0919918.1 hypothetical protein [Enterococcus sp. B1E2]WIV15390.1 hypothetical protein QN079_15830 [Enterococcus sp. FZMF]